MPDYAAMTLPELQLAALMAGLSLVDGAWHIDGRMVAAPDAPGWRWWSAGLGAETVETEADALRAVLAYVVP